MLMIVLVGLITIGVMCLLQLKKEQLDKNRKITAEKNLENTSAEKFL